VPQYIADKRTVTRKKCERREQNEQRSSPSFSDVYIEPDSKYRAAQAISTPSPKLRLVTRFFQWNTRIGFFFGVGGVLLDQHTLPQGKQPVNRCTSLFLYAVLHFTACGQKERKYRITLAGGECKESGAGAVELLLREEPTFGSQVPTVRGWEPV